MKTSSSTRLMVAGATTFCLLAGSLSGCAGPRDAAVAVEKGPVGDIPPAVDAGTATTDASGDATVAPTFETLQFVINEAPCFGAGCHNDDQNPLNLQADDQLYSRLTSQVSRNCGGIPVISPGQPADSALVQLLKGPCGDTPRMPIGCVEDEDATCIPPEYIAAIERWIALGAPMSGSGR